jgi:hypothetical protein
MDNMVASGVLYVNVIALIHVEQFKISLLTVKKSRIVTVTVDHAMIVSIIFMHYAEDYLRQTSVAVRYIEFDPINIEQLGDDGGRKLPLNPTDNQK